MEFIDTWSTATVCRTRNVTPTIRLFELDPAGHGVAWSPGSHIRVRLQAGESCLERSYSLIDDGSVDGLFRIAVKLDENGAGGSRALWALRPGDAVGISAPENRFELSLNAASYTLIAGGVGITPLLGMARLLAGSGRPLRLLHSVHSRAEAAFADLLQAWLGDRFALNLSAETGRLDLGKLIADIEPDGELYVCGPIGMLEAAREAWQAAARPPASLRYESFASSGHYASLPFTAVLPRHGCEIEVPANQSLLAALEALHLPGKRAEPRLDFG